MTKEPNARLIAAAPMILNGVPYKFGPCPKCGKWRAMSPVSGLCWLCGGHDLDVGLSQVDPLLKAVLDDLDRRMEKETNPQELIGLILLAEQLSERI